MPRTVGGSGWSHYYESVRSRFRRWLLGQPLATSVQLEHRLPIYLALPVFASDALSSVAYATEEILIVLAGALFVTGQPAIRYVLPLSFAIAVLMAIVATSYRQAIRLYPSGGGSYSVSRDNLGMLPGVIAASALTIDYILTVAVSVSAAVAALTSAFPLLLEVKVLLALLLVGLITLVNLRGTRESGWTFALPAYSFITMISVLIIGTLIHVATGTVVPVPRPEEVQAPVITSFGLFVLLRAFSNGCSALTGVEAVSNGVSAFEPPEAQNASKTLLVLVTILVILFVGVSYSAYVYHVLPTENETVISQLARANFGRSALFYLINFTTLVVLMVAANTSFAGFPRLMAIVASDRFAPKSFTTLGDRLVFTRGIMVLTIVSALLIWYFRASVTALIPLYAVGVFICFTLSQFGMVRRIRLIGGRGWQRQALVNGVGGVATGIVAVVIAASKFAEGAWVVILLIPLLVLFSYAIHRHYIWFSKTMRVHTDDFNPLAEPAEPLTVLVLVSSDIHRGILEGLECGRSLTEGKRDAILRAVHIEMDPEKTPRLKAKWAELVEPYLGQKIKLDIVPSPYRWLVEPILDYLDWADLERNGDRVIVVLPEFETGSYITHFLHNFTARRLRTALLNRPHVTVVSSRYFMRPMAWRAGRGGLVY